MKMRANFSEGGGRKERESWSIWINHVFEISLWMQTPWDFWAPTWWWRIDNRAHHLDTFTLPSFLRFPFHPSPTPIIHPSTIRQDDWPLKRGHLHTQTASARPSHHHHFIRIALFWMKEQMANESALFGPPTKSPCKSKPTTTDLLYSLSQLLCNA